jgi:hypothetical protein
LYNVVMGYTIPLMRTVRHPRRHDRVAEKKVEAPRAFVRTDGVGRAGGPAPIRHAPGVRLATTDKFLARSNRFCTSNSALSVTATAGTGLRPQ